MITSEKIAGILGIFLAVAAIVLSQLYPSQTALITLFSVCSVILLVWFTRKHITDLRRVAGKKRTWLKINAMFLVVLLAFIIVTVNLVFRQYYFRLDFSTTREYSLSERSKKVASLVDREIRIIFFGRDETDGFKRASELLESFRYLNKKIVFSLSDLDMSPRIASKYGVREYNTFVADNGKRYFTAQGVNEKNIANLLIRATLGEQKKILFVKGHGERKDNFTERSAYGKALGLIRDIGYKVINDSVDALSDDIDLVMIVSPMKDFSKDEIETLKEYLNRDGKLLLIVDSSDMAPSVQALFSISIGDYLIHDLNHATGLGPTSPFLYRIMNKDVFGERFYKVVMPTVREIVQFPNVQYEYRLLVRVTRDSWRDVNGNGKFDDEDESTGLEDVGVLIVQKDGLMKTIVLSDGDFASNAYIELFDNRAFFTTLVNWLTGEGALIDIPPPEPIFIPMYVSPDQRRKVRFTGPIGIPLLFIFAGFIVYLWRRRL